MNDIIVGVDQSATARTAAETAASLATACGSNLHIVMCVKPGTNQEFAVGGDRWRLDSLSQAEDFLHDLRRTLGHETITSAVAFGDPATTMCEEAQRLGARMIVVGNRRVQGASRILGSIAADVTKQAPCDVLIANTAAS